MISYGTSLSRYWVAVLAATLQLCVASIAGAVPVGADAELDRLEPMPSRLDGVRLEERLGGHLPLETPFTDSDGQAVTLGRYFDSRRPVVLTFNYSDCPMLCGLQIKRFVDSLRQMDRTIGEDFQILTISLDPAETPEQAAKTKARHLADYGRASGAQGWHFVVGAEQATRAVAAAAGISYEFNEARQEWLHPAAVTLLTPEGKIARYLYGIEYHPETMSLAVVEASEGKIGTTIDRLILYCFHYDESEGRYAPAAMNIMRVGAGLVALALGAFLTLYWVAESRRRRKATLAHSSVS
jgi:protein SCO1/2